MNPVAEFRQLVQLRGQELRSRRFDQLVGFPTSESEEVAVGSRSGRITVNVEPQPDGKLRVVVQGFMKTRIHIGSHVALDGFYKHPDGMVSPMADDEFYGYD